MSQFLNAYKLLGQLWDRTDRYRLILIREELLEIPDSRQEHVAMDDAVANSPT